MFASPVVYGMNLIPARWQTVYSINPLVGIIESFRAALFGGTIQGFSIIASCVITLLALLYGTYTFKRREKVFADII
jgi:lipopolysaccharide transport system permease protein